VGVTGRHFFGKKEIKSSDKSYDKTLQDGLWFLSRELSGIDLLL
jgi:hypothetical protein